MICHTSRELINHALGSIMCLKDIKLNYRSLYKYHVTEDNVKAEDMKNGFKGGLSYYFDQENVQIICVNLHLSSH